MFNVDEGLIPASEYFEQFKINVKYVAHVIKTETIKYVAHVIKTETIKYVAQVIKTVKL